MKIVWQRIPERREMKLNTSKWLVLQTYWLYQSSNSQADDDHIDYDICVQSIWLYISERWLIIDTDIWEDQWR